MPYRTTASRIDRDQALRSRILACAHARVVEGGFAALTMQALAEDVGIATGSLYRHFGNKGELAAEVFARASQLEVDSLGEVLRGEGSAAERLARGLRHADIGIKHCPRRLPLRPAPRLGALGAAIAQLVERRIRNA